MAEPKTTLNDASVEEFIANVEPQRQDDCHKLVQLMSKATGEKPKMWGTSIVGFGSYHYKYASGREGDWMLIGFSPRKNSFSINIMPGLGNYGPLLAKLGKHKNGKSCLHVKSLADVHMATLKKIINESVKDMRKKYG